MKNKDVVFLLRELQDSVQAKFAVAINQLILDMHMPKKRVKRKKK